MTTRQRRKRKRTIMILAAVTLIAAAFSVWLAIKPRMEKQKELDSQNELLESIQRGDGVIVPEELSIDEPVDFYDGGEDAPPEEIAVLLPMLAATGNSDAPGPDAPLTGMVNGIGILTIGKIDLKLPVSEGVKSAQLKISVGHVPQTAAIGDMGNAVIAGHRSYEYGKHFNRLGEMEKGDFIQYRSIGGKDMEFIVDEILEVLPGDPTAFAQTADKAQITLYTCTPIRKATHRLLVRATRVK